MPGAIGQNLSDRNNCLYCFAFCESCFLIATILESHEDCNNIAYHPICLEKLSLILLRPNEIFQCHIKCVHGINLARILTISPELGPLQQWPLLLLDDIDSSVYTTKESSCLTVIDT
jgi:hypothetical protein